MAMTATELYDASQWPDLASGAVPLAPVRVGMDARTGQLLVGWPHVLQSISRIFSTRFHTRVLRRYVGSFIPHVLGRSIMERTLTDFYWAIATSLDLWEPDYSIQQIYIDRAPDGTVLTTSDDVRAGKVRTVNSGVYKPRGHLGDNTPYSRRQIIINGRGSGVWESR